MQKPTKIGSGCKVQKKDFGNETIGEIIHGDEADSDWYIECPSDCGEILTFVLDFEKFDIPIRTSKCLWCGLNMEAKPLIKQYVIRVLGKEKIKKNLVKGVCKSSYIKSYSKFKVPPNRPDKIV